jgi:hypothetical protein
VRLIDADALIEHMEEDMEQMEEPLAKMFTGAAISDIKHAPTVEAPDINVGNMDAISRQQAIDALDKRFDKIPMGQTTEILMLRKDLRELPPVQPEREKGEWVYNSPVTMKCNRCGLVIKDWDWQRFKICPNCGADMRGEQDENHNIHLR